MTKKTSHELLLERSTALREYINVVEARPPKVRATRAPLTPPTPPVTPPTPSATDTPTEAAPKPRAAASPPPPPPTPPTPPDAASGDGHGLRNKTIGAGVVGVVGTGIYNAVNRDGSTPAEPTTGSTAHTTGSTAHTTGSTAHTTGSTAHTTGHKPTSGTTAQPAAHRESNPQIAKWQAYLNQNYNAGLAVDGIYGPHTSAAYATYIASQANQGQSTAAGNQTKMQDWQRQMRPSTQPSQYSGSPIREHVSFSADQELASIVQLARY